MTRLLLAVSLDYAALFRRKSLLANDELSQAGVALPVPDDDRASESATRAKAARARQRACFALTLGIDCPVIDR